MSDTFIPTTDAVRTYFGIGVDEALAHFDGEEQFDRWLAAHDAEVYQRGREDADRWCNIADIAYRKGRDDAAQAVEAACRMWQCSREELRHYTEAARGDGEQA